jgi:hypothetical protein
MKARLELRLRSLTDKPELVVREKVKVNPIAVSAVWGAKKSVPSKPPCGKTSTLRMDSPVWHASTR